VITENYTPTFVLHPNGERLLLHPCSNSAPLYSILTGNAFASSYYSIRAQTVPFGD